MDAKTHWKKVDENQGTVCIIYLYSTLSLSLLSLSIQREERERETKYDNKVTKIANCLTLVTSILFNTKWDIECSFDYKNDVGK